MYGNISSPHPRLPFSESDREFIIKESRIDESRTRIIDNFKKFIDQYNFNYKVDSEIEFDRLKEKVLASEDFLKNNSKNNNLIKNFLNKSKYNKLFKELERYIEKKKNKHFYKDDNSIWLVNMILREYSKMTISNNMQVKTSLYIDSEYYNAIDVLSDIAKYNRVLSLYSD